MDVVLLTTDPVRLSWARAVLAAEGIETLVFDEQMSLAEGSIGAFPRRLMVDDRLAPRARNLLDEAAQALGETGPISAPPRRNPSGAADGPGSAAGGLAGLVARVLGPRR
jgi:hypothetical protein